MIESVEMIIRQPGHPDRVVRLQEGATRLGRSEDCEIVLSDVGVSRRHARLLVARDEVAVEDLGSGNGTYFHGRRIERQRLKDSDEVVIDPFVLRFRIRRDGQDQPDEPTLDGPLARFDVIHGTGLAQSSYALPPKGLTMGRSETRDIVIPDPAASRHHCSVFFQDGHYVLRDMGSANGVYVNGYRVKEAVLNDGDRMQVGNTELRFVLDDATKADGGTPSSSPPHRRRREGGRSWEDVERWSESDLSLPHPEAGRRRGGAGGWVSMALGGATLFTFMVLVMVVSGALLYVVINRTAAPRATTVASGPPTWTLAIPDAPAPDPASADKLFETGMQAMRQHDHRAALQAFYLALKARPNDPASERFAFVAGEYVVLGALRPALDAQARAAEARERRRIELLDEARHSGRRGRIAADTLASEFRDDPTVQKAMGWGPSARTRKLQERIAAAAVALTRENWADAAAIYADVLAKTHDPPTRQTARGGLKVARRELARGCAEEWRAGILAEAGGKLDEARAHYQKVLALDPGNPSARLHLARLDAGK